MTRAQQIKAFDKLYDSFESELLYDDNVIKEYADKAQRIAPRHSGYYVVVYKQAARRIQAQREQ